MPTSNRPALGKGPTGRGLAKSRSRITVDSFKTASNTSSPTPPSNSPTTPTMECPIPLPAPHNDPFNEMPSMEPGDIHVSNSFQFPQQEKGIDHNVGCVDQYAYNGIPNSEALVNLPSDFESVSISHGIHAVDPSMNGHQMFPDYAWATQGPPTIGVQADTPVRQAAFSFTQQTAATSMAPRTLNPQYRPAHGHRRAATEPQSLGSLIAAGFNPGHRPSSSEAFTSTPSPPPLPIRAPFPAHVYQ